MKNPIDRAIAKINAEIDVLEKVKERLLLEHEAGHDLSEAAPRKERKARKKRGMPAADAATGSLI